MQSVLNAMDIGEKDVRVSSVRLYEYARHSPKRWKMERTPTLMAVDPLEYWSLLRRTDVKTME